MSFEEALATQPMWIRLWVNWMGIAIIISIVVLLFSKVTRRDAAIILITNAIAFGSMQWLYQKVGYVRLLGIVHVILWTPLALYLWQRLKVEEIGVPYRQVIWLLLATMIISLGFDYVDVARYLLGEHASMVPSS